MRIEIRDTEELVQYLHPATIHEVRFVHDTGGSSTSTSVERMTTAELRELWERVTDRLGSIR